MGFAGLLAAWTGPAVPVATAAATAAPIAALHGTVAVATSVAGSSRVATNQSNNWFGYQQGALESAKLFSQVSGEWTVPTATQHTAGQAEFSATWIGIGGGCIDATCLLADSATLIQAGTNQDVDAAGQPSYSAWFEVIPGPQIAIGSLPTQAPFSVHPGDRMRVEIAETLPFSNLWTVTVLDKTQAEQFVITVPYTSSHLSAEWVTETPLQFGSAPGIAALPNLTPVTFDLARANGAPANLFPSEALQLVDTTPAGNVVASPSAPDSDGDGFNDCTYVATMAACSIPAS
ncbi:MAG: G1 family glutamic endopeptidase [Acidimicrobiales bacterium]